MTPRSAILVLCLLSAACAATRPGWVANPPQPPGYATVVGVATGQPTPEEARRAAYAAALARLTQQFGFTSQVTYRETSREKRGVAERSVEEKLETASPEVRLEAPEVAERFEERGGAQTVAGTPMCWCATPSRPSGASRSA